VQATVRDWDPVTRAGSVLADDGTALAFSGDAVQCRGLRLGQRVTLQIESEQVVALTIATLPLR
jgi:hypothetical protein